MKKSLTLLALLLALAFAPLVAAQQIGPAGSGSGAPSGAAGGDLGGSYPNPTIVSIENVTTGSFSGPTTLNVPLLGSGLLNTTSTTGFPYMSTFGGVPTGTPTAESGYVAFGYDTTHNRFYVYNSGWGLVGTAVSSLAGATASNSFDNANNTQTWTWNSLGANTALSITTTDLTTGKLLDVEATGAVGGTGPAGFFANATTSFGAGVEGIDSSTSNTGGGVAGFNNAVNGYGGYFGNNAAGGVALYVTATDSSTNTPLEVVNNASGSFVGGFTLSAPNLVATQDLYFQWGQSATTGNMGSLGFYYAGSNSGSNRMDFDFFNKNPVISVTNGGLVGIGNKTNPSDQLDINGGLGLTATTATVPTTGIYSPSSGILSLATTGSGDVVIPNVTTGSLLCLTSTGSIGHCTAAASCTNTCTCTCSSN